MSAALAPYLLSWCPGQDPPVHCDPCASEWVLVQGLSEDLSAQPQTFKGLFRPPGRTFVPLKVGEREIYFGLGVAPPYNGALQSGLCFTWYNVDSFNPDSSVALVDVPVIYHGVTIWEFGGFGLPEYSISRGTFSGTDHNVHTLTAGQNAVSFPGAVPVGPVWPDAPWQNWSIIPYDGPIAFDDSGEPIFDLSIPTTEIIAPASYYSPVHPDLNGALISASWNVAKPQTIGIFYRCRKL